MATRAMPPGRQAGAYTFSSQPQAVGGRTKYRDQPASGTVNIMHDRRVKRGSAYVQPRATAAGEEQQQVRSEQADAARRARGRRQEMEEDRVLTPEPLAGREHIDVQTDVYLEEITDKVVEADVDTQTDPFLDRPPSPVYVPRKAGVDVFTQIENGDLFDFDFEVQPLLEVLIGKTLEQAMEEVLEEQELLNIQKHQVDFERRRNAELAETQRQEAAEQRRIEEKERRLEQEKMRLEKERLAREHVAAERAAHQYLDTLQNSVFDRLADSGFFYDPVLRTVEKEFLPWAYSEMENKLEKAAVARRLVDDVLQRSLALAMRKRWEAVTIAKEAAVRDAARQAQLALEDAFDESDLDSQDDDLSDDEDYD